MFKALSEELKHWADGETSAQFWWRDDDVQAPSSALEQLLSISQSHQTPLALAAIPSEVTTELVDCLNSRSGIHVLQHGVSHQNFARENKRKIELGGTCPTAEIQQRLREGFDQLQALFGAQFAPVLVPPWNRIESRVVTELSKIGFAGLSTLGSRQKVLPAEGVKQVNVHVDIINWKQGRCFAGADKCIDQVVSHLSAKRMGLTDPDEPTGIMSHHLVHDDGCWRFLEALFDQLSRHQNVALLDAKTVFAIT